MWLNIKAVVCQHCVARCDGTGKGWRPKRDGRLARCCVAMVIYFQLLLTRFSVTVSSFSKGSTVTCIYKGN